MEIRNEFGEKIGELYTGDNVGCLGAIGLVVIFGGLMGCTYFVYKYFNSYAIAFIYALVILVIGFLLKRVEETFLVVAKIVGTIVILAIIGVIIYYLIQMDKQGKKL